MSALADISLNRNVAQPSPVAGSCTVSVRESECGSGTPPEPAGEAACATSRRWFKASRNGWLRKVLSRNRLDAGLAFFYPETCQICGSERATARDGFVCEPCRSQVHFINPPYCERCGLPYPGDLTTPFECTNCREMELHFSSARSAVVAHNVVREAIHRYKYQRALWFESFLTDMFLRKALPALRGRNWDFIVPVPLHPVKRREREFNQAEHLAARLSTHAAIPMNPRLLERLRQTATQTRLTRQERAANMRGAFAVSAEANLDGKRIILVDDVFTTGSTTNACAQVLKAAGASDVCVWTVARGL